MASKTRLISIAFGHKAGLPPSKKYLLMRQPLFLYIMYHFLLYLSTSLLFFIKLRLFPTEKTLYITIQYLHSYKQKSIPARLRRWDFCLPAYVFLRSAQQVRRPAEQLPLYIKSGVPSPGQHSETILSYLNSHKMTDLSSQS